MSAISLILLCAAAVATALGGAALHTARGLRRQLTALRAQLAPAEAEGTGTVPPARTAAKAAPGVDEEADSAFARQIRAAVAAALADERERELAEARAFWAAQEARDAAPGSGGLLAGHGTEYEIAEIAPGDLSDHFLDCARAADAAGPAAETDALPGSGPVAGELFIPRQPGPEDGDRNPDAGIAWDEHTGPDGLPQLDGSLEVDVDENLPQRPEADPASRALRDGSQDGASGPGRGERSGAAAEEEPPDLAAARRRHPSQPDYNLNGEPVVPGAAPSPAPTVTYHERTIERLAGLADARVPLADVRPGPLGTLDLYVFEDGTTVCLSPGHRATSEALADAVRRGEAPVLMGGSGIAGSYALTFGYPDGSTAYLLADRVITPL
ncbi:hypothetical protein ACF1DY_27140 [Streptomyces albus]